MLDYEWYFVPDPMLVPRGIVSKTDHSQARVGEGDLGNYYN